MGPLWMDDGQKLDWSVRVPIRNVTNKPSDWSDTVKVGNDTGPE